MTTAKANLISAMCDFHTKVETIHKLSKAQYGQYADLQTVLGVVTPALSECGLAITQTFGISEGYTLLITTLRHISGELVMSEVPLIAEGGRNALHSWGGAVTYQRRYAILAILNLAAGIEDDDGDSAPSIRIQKTSPFNSDEFL
jgi:hypothetical protein